MKHLIPFIAFSLIYYSVQAQDYFQQTIDDTTLAGEQIFLNKIVPAPNGNFFVAGYEQWFVGSQPNYAIVVIMVDSNGNMLWNKIYKDFLKLKFQKIVPFPEGCYVLGFNDSYSILMKLDVEGNLMEANVISNTNSSLFLDNMVAYNGGILLSGQGNFYSSGEDIFLLKADSDGNFTTLGQHNFSTGFYVTGIIADNPGFYLLGWMWNGPPGSVANNGIISRFNGAGDLLWVKKFKLDGGYGRTFVRAGNINEDHTINIVYDASDLFGYYTKIGLCRIDSNGNFLLEKEFDTELPAPLVINAMSLSEEKEITLYAIYGGTSSISIDDTMMIFRVDEDFNLIWAKSCDHVSNVPWPFSEPGGGIAEMGGGNLMISGYNHNVQRGVIKKITPDGLGCNVQDFFLKNFNKPLTILDSNNNSSEDYSVTQTPASLTVSSPLISYFGCDTLATAVTEPIPSSLHLFPNPFNHKFKLATNANSEITIYDVAGKFLESHKNITGEFSGGEQLTAGIYFIEIKNSSGDREMLKVVRMQ